MEQVQPLNSPLATMHLQVDGPGTSRPDCPSDNARLDGASETVTEHPLGGRLGLNQSIERVTEHAHLRANGQGSSLKGRRCRPRGNVRARCRGTIHNHVARRGRVTRRCRPVSLAAETRVIHASILPKAAQNVKGVFETISQASRIVVLSDAFFSQKSVSPSWFDSCKAGGASTTG